jgi:hypothetical protein
MYHLRLWGLRADILIMIFGKRIRFVYFANDDCSTKFDLFIRYLREIEA